MQVSPGAGRWCDKGGTGRCVKHIIQFIKAGNDPEHMVPPLCDTVTELVETAAIQPIGREVWCIQPQKLQTVNNAWNEKSAHSNGLSACLAESRKSHLADVGTHRGLQQFAPGLS